MRSLIKHFYNCQKIHQLLKKAEVDELAKNLYWYNLSIKFASSKFGFIKVFFWRIFENFFNIFFFFKKNKKLCLQ